MTAQDYHHRATYYERLAVQLGAEGALESVFFYQQVAQRCRDYAGYAKEAA